MQATCFHELFKGLCTLHDPAVVRLCNLQAVVRADTAHYTRRMLSPMSGACTLYFLTNKCAIEVHDEYWRLDMTNPRNWTHKLIVQMENWRAWWRHTYVTMTVVQPRVVQCAAALRDTTSRSEILLCQKITWQKYFNSSQNVLWQWNSHGMQNACHQYFHSNSIKHRHIHVINMNNVKPGMHWIKVKMQYTVSYGLRGKAEGNKDILTIKVEILLFIQCAIQWASIHSELQKLKIATAPHNLSCNYPQTTFPSNPLLRILLKSYYCQVLPLLTHLPIIKFPSGGTLVCCPSQRMTSSFCRLLGLYNPLHTCMGIIKETESM